MLCQITWTTVPASIGALFFMLFETINMIFIGHLDNPKLVSAVGLGNIILNIGAVGVFCGINSSIEILCSQAYGAKDHVNCGIYLKRGRIAVMLLSVPVAVILLLSKSVLSMCGQNEVIVELSQTYIYAVMPGVLLLGLNDLQ